VPLVAGTPEMHLAGSSYRQEPDEIHRTVPADGTVTIIEQDRRETDTARTFWPAGLSWVDAIPREATYQEVLDIGGYGLQVLTAQRDTEDTHSQAGSSPSGPTMRQPLENGHLHSRG